MPEAFFVLKIHTRTGHFGETSASERCGIADILRRAASEIMSGAPATPLRDLGNHVVGEYEFGAGMISGPGEGFDRRHCNVPPAHAGSYGKLKQASSQ